MRSSVEAPSARDVRAGLALGLGGLLLIAAALVVVDPLLRDPAGQVFSVSEILRIASAR